MEILILTYRKTEILNYNFIKKRKLDKILIEMT